jgi:hypothetical protein
MPQRKIAAVPRPEVLQLYKEVDPGLPALLIQAADRQLEREYRYALQGQGIAAMGMVLVIGGFVYLVMMGHHEAAGSLLGTGLVGLVLAFLRSRLGTPESSEKEESIEMAAPYN